MQSSAPPVTHTFCILNQNHHIGWSSVASGYGHFLSEDFLWGFSCCTQRAYGDQNVLLALEMHPLPLPMALLRPNRPFFVAPNFGSPCINRDPSSRINPRNSPSAKPACECWQIHITRIFKSWARHIWQSQPDRITLKGSGSTHGANHFQWNAKA
jgi:hypothetical protein